MNVLRYFLFFIPLIIKSMHILDSFDKLETGTVVPTWQHFYRYHYRFVPYQGVDPGRLFI